MLPILRRAKEGVNRHACVRPAANARVVVASLRYHGNFMLRKIVIALCGILIVCGISLIAARIVIDNAARHKTYTDVALIPKRRVGLVLGCPKRIPGGWLNPFFENRIAAAAELYHRQKVDFLVVSGDNHIQSYDEPKDMKNALIEKGVPKDRIYLDYAGLRTLDSVVRVKEIFGQEKVTIVSQHFHNQRAIFLAEHHGIDAIGLDAPDVAREYAYKTLLREQFAKVKAVLDVYLLHKPPHFLGEKITVGFPQAVLDPQQAPELARMMCEQLPNLSSYSEHTVIEAPPGIPIPEPDVNGFGISDDDTYNALYRLGRYSVPCLVDRLTDARWMPDPRSEPLLGAPVVGDVAYMVLGDKGVPDVLPALAHKKPDELRMDDFFIWPSEGDHRKRLQDAVRAWLREHPNCCDISPIVLRAAPAQPSFRMPEEQIAAARLRFARLRPGMNADEVVAIAGKPDATDAGDGTSASGAETFWKDPRLLGWSAKNHDESMAYIYFTERWADEIARRDPLHDRYLILYFSGEGKFVRMFSNVPSISPIFPSSAAAWRAMMFPEPAKKQ
jgi:SanA protein